jgi:uncharacterized protein YndB with AHSA1/START domain
MADYGAEAAMMTSGTSTPLEIRRMLAAPIEDVFAAWIDQDGMREWFSPTGVAEVTADFRPGGSFRLGIVDGNVSIDCTGVFRIVDPHVCSFLLGAHDIPVGVTPS